MSDCICVYPPSSLIWRATISSSPQSHIGYEASVSSIVAVVLWCDIYAITSVEMLALTPGFACSCLILSSHIIIFQRAFTWIKQINHVRQMQSSTVNFDSNGWLMSAVRGTRSLGERPLAICPSTYKFRGGSYYDCTFA